MTYTYTLLGKRWKPIILWKLRESELSFTELQEAIPLISRKMLFTELRELADRGLIDYINGTEPKRYRITPHGESLAPVLEAMEAWGRENRPERLS